MQERKSGENRMNSGRSFLFLQGPHGPFFGELAQKLAAAGVNVHRIGFNAGDAHYWPLARDYTPFCGALPDWRATLEAALDRLAVTDLVLYGDTRPVHALARIVARERGLTVHCFEEGYLRPYWITYERGGVNGNSRLMQMTVAEMRARLGGRTAKLPDAPAQWGALWHHILYGALYHGRVFLANGAYPNFRPHRDIPVSREVALYMRRLAMHPAHAAGRRLATRRLRRSGANFHLVLLQLAHDSSFREHSDFAHIGEFVDTVCRGFAEGAPPHHWLVFKTHPLEDGREPLRRIIGAAARAHRIEGRVQIIRGGKLGEMLDDASSAVTVNSTAGQQALWRGLPIRAFGRSVYDKPEFVSTQPIAEFFADARPPDREAYMVYRQFLLETSQIPGGFYTASGRADVLRHASEMMLAEGDPYDLHGGHARQPALRVIMG